VCLKEKFLILGLILILSSGCVQPHKPTSETAISPVTTEISSIIPTGTVSSSPTRTKVVEMQPSNAPTLIPTIPVTPTRTLVPTLAPGAARSQLENVIRDQNHCLLPCWLGITPGVSTSNDFDSVFARYSALLNFYNADKDGIISRGITFELGQGITSNFYIDYRTRANQNIIDTLYISTQALRKIDVGFQDEYTSEYYHQLLKDYSLSQVLTEYGVPSKVSMNVRFYLYDGSPPSPSQKFGSFKIRLFYPEQGVIAIYEMPLIKMGEYGKACPANSFVNLWLTSPDNDGYYEKLLSSRQKEGEDFDYDKTTDEAVNMSLEQFYEMFRTPNQKCLQTPLSAWPPPYSR
jgi:hypothetical protein